MESTSPAYVSTPAPTSMSPLATEGWLMTLPAHEAANIAHANNKPVVSLERATGICSAVCVITGFGAPSLVVKASISAGRCWAVAASAFKSLGGFKTSGNRARMVSLVCKLDCISISSFPPPNVISGLVTQKSHHRSRFGRAHISGDRAKSAHIAWTTESDVVHKAGGSPFRAGEFPGTQRAGVCTGKSTRPSCQAGWRTVISA